jgi:hypothetical protein
MNFRVTALSPAPFAPLFMLSDQALAERGAVRCVADSSPGYPCRVSLEDARPGEKVLLVHFEHHAVSSPFRASHAIYVREGVRQAALAPGEIPQMLQRRLLSVRAFDERGMLVDADVVEGEAVDGAIRKMLESPRPAYLHLHFAKPGCYAARVDRG